MVKVIDWPPIRPLTKAAVGSPDKGMPVPNNPLHRVAVVDVRANTGAVQGADERIMHKMQ